MLETKRLTLRPIIVEDSKAVFHYRSDSETNQFQKWIPHSLKEVHQFISKNPEKINKPETWFQLVIIEKQSGQLFGDIGIHFIDKENKQCELGCTLDKDFHSKGYASEALSDVIEYLFKKLDKHRIIASIDPKNTNSVKLMERLGFRKEAHFRESIYMNGKWFDDIVYAQLNREWKKRM